MRLLPLNGSLPGWKNALLALLSAVLLILAFPDFDYWFLAWFALAPLMWSVERERDSTWRSFVVGWIFGTVFFFGTCWWLTYAPITYAAFPPILAYFLLFCVCLVAGLFPAMFAAILSVLLRRFGSLAFLVAPFVWVFTEFLRYWVTGNNWNALGYSQAFSRIEWVSKSASIGGVFLTSFDVACFSTFVALLPIVGLRIRKIGVESRLSSFSLTDRLPIYALAAYLYPILGLVLFLIDSMVLKKYRRPNQARLGIRFSIGLVVLIPLILNLLVFFGATRPRWSTGIFTAADTSAYVVAVQANVPMYGITASTYDELRRRHISLAESAFEKNVEKYVQENLLVYPDWSREYGANEKFYREFYRKRFAEESRLVVFPESPMNFMYETDPETREFIDGFARTNNVSVLFNSAEPNDADGKFYNSAVMVGPQGGEVAQYDKIYLLPFGEAVPFPLEGILPGFVGNFSYGKEYDLFPLGDAKAGVMICFESHFGALSREYVRNGADVIIEMTNDGYLGPTPVLRQHLANAVFRAVETNRPVLRVTNVGITAYINEKGEVLDAAPAYQTDTRVWSVSKSDGSQTFYVRYGDWFAWLCSLVTVGLLAFAFIRRDAQD